MTLLIFTSVVHQTQHLRFMLNVSSIPILVLSKRTTKRTYLVRLRILVFRELFSYEPPMDMGVGQYSLRPQFRPWRTLPSWAKSNLCWCFPWSSHVSRTFGSTPHISVHLGLPTVLGAPAGIRGLNLQVDLHRLRRNTKHRSDLRRREEPTLPGESKSAGVREGPTGHSNRAQCIFFVWETVLFCFVSGCQIHSHFLFTRQMHP